MSVEDVPHDLVSAIAHANRVVDWQENLSSDEMPPAWMWPFEDDLEIWFEDVEARRKEKYGGGDSSSAGDTDVPLMSNELSRGRGR